MGLEDILCRVGAQLLRECELIDYAERLVELLKDGWSDPRFENKPSTNIETSDFLTAPGKVNRSFGQRLSISHVR